MRRAGAKIVVAACLLLLFAAMGQSRTEAASEAGQALDDTVTAVLVELKRPELKNPATRAAVLERVEKIITNLFSIEELSMRTVGPNWKNFTADQKKRFIEAFSDLLRERYAGSLDGYNGETVSYTGEVPIGGGGDKVQIDSTVSIRGKPVPVSYRMLKKGKWVVYDVIIEGVSMVQNYRSQFQSVLQKGDAEELITLVRAKATETQVQAGDNRK
jgi:phospholipid transport system substrate-binding protein